MSRRNLTVLLSALLVAIVCGGRNVPPRARHVAEAFGQIDRYALFQPSDQALVAGALEGMVGVLREQGDEHSGYSDPRAAERFLADIRQEFGGVGVRIRFDGEPLRLTLIGPPEPDGPASQAGLRAGDVVSAIDGVATADMLAAAESKLRAEAGAANNNNNDDDDGQPGEPSADPPDREALLKALAVRRALEQVLEAMRGPVGEPVVLSIVRGDGENAEQFQVPLVRAEIVVPSVIGDRRRPDGEWEFLLEEDPRIALVRVQSFGNKTLEELEEVVPRLLEAGAGAIVVDLRDNPGGALDITIESCNLFLTAGAGIVETRGRDKQPLAEFTAHGGPFTEVPLAVLINDQSASAAEIMAACFQDNRRAAIIGERSFGKGTVQRILDIESGRSLLKLTTASFWRPGGVNIHRMPGDSDDAAWGVRPDDGLSLDLTDEQHAAWRRYRSERDVAAAPVESKPVEGKSVEGKSVEGKPSENEPGEGVPGGEPVGDAVLRLAVEHLAATLDKHASVEHAAAAPAE